MIEQLHYATRSRYNFPQVFEETGFPRRLMDLSLNSMQSIKGKHFQPYEAEFPSFAAERPISSDPIRLHGKAFSTLLTPLEPIKDGTTVIGIDVSSIRVGETETGSICAIRGAIVWNEKQHYQYVRLGPFPFHVTEISRSEAPGEPRLDASSGHSVDPSTPVETQNHLCSLVERWIQAGVSFASSRSIILWDGSLTSGMPGNPVSAISHILRVARRNSNSVLAFSKATTIRFLGWKITDLALNQKPPCLLEVENLPLSISRTTSLLGRIFAAKLAEGGYSFRLDIDRALSREYCIKAVERLLGNELMFQGYPETLRLAHIYSTFTANDVLGIQSFLAAEYGLKVVPRCNIRKTLFGPFGTGYED